MSSPPAPSHRVSIGSPCQSDKGPIYLWPWRPGRRWWDCSKEETGHVVMIYSLFLSKSLWTFYYFKSRAMGTECKEKRETICWAWPLRPGELLTLGGQRAKRLPTLPPLLSPQNQKRLQTFLSVLWTAGGSYMNLIKHLPGCKHFKFYF